MSAPFQLLLNADVFAPRSLGVRHVLVCSERIVWIGDEAPQFPARGPAVETTDLGGRALVPGLIDCHAHITGGGGETGPESRVPPLSLSRFTTAGITTVVGLLGTDDVTRDTASLVATARSLTAEGLTAFCYTGGYHVPPVTLTGDVRRDIVHIDRIIGVGELAISDHRSSQPTLDEVLRIAADAHVAGIMTGKAGTLHLHMGDGERGLDLVRQALDKAEIPARTYHPTHVNRRRALFEEALELARRGCTVDVTAFPVAPETDEVSATEAWERFADADLPPERLTLSSDGGGCLPVFDEEGRPVDMDVAEPAALPRALGALLEAGHSLDKVLPAFTENPARLLRFARKGRIETGADADLVVLDGHQVADVMVRGRWHVRNGEPQVRGAFEG